jgi:hypothetical protein
MFGCLFRLTEVESGEIKIDGVSISKVRDSEAFCCKSSSEFLSPELDLPPAHHRFLSITCDQAWL